LVSIAEAQQNISKTQEQLAQQKQQVSQYQQDIPQTTQEQLRGRQGFASRITAPLKALLQRRGYTQQRQKAQTAQEQIAQAEQQVKQQEEQLQKYLRTEQGIKQYAQENKISGTPIYGKPFKGASVELLGYTYSTPYGSYTDYGPRDRLLGQQAKVEAYESAETRVVAEALGLTSPKELEQAGVDVRQFLSEQPQTIKTDIGNVQAGQTIQLDKGTGEISFSGLEQQRSTIFDNIGKNVSSIPFSNLQSTDKTIFNMGGTPEEFISSRTPKRSFNFDQFIKPSSYRSPFQDRQSTMGSYLKSITKDKLPTSRTYIPELDSYVSRDIYGGSTALLTSPTIREARKIERLQSNLLTADIGKLQKRYETATGAYEKAQKIEKELETLSKSNIDESGACRN